MFLFWNAIERNELDLVAMPDQAVLFGAWAVLRCCLGFCLKVNIFITCFCFVAFDKVSKESGDSFYIK